LLGEWPDFGICGQNIGGRDYGLEAALVLIYREFEDLYHGLPVCFCDYSALVAVSTNHHDNLVLVLVHIGKGRVALYEHAGIHRDTQLAAQVGHALRLMFSTAVREKNKGNLLRLEIREGLVGSR
jgi:hypothetical protein